MFKKLIKLSLLLFILSALFLVISNVYINKSSEGKTFNSISEIGKNKVGLVLGTSKKLASGRINLYFLYRVEATVKLFKSGKIDYVLISGDNSTKTYDEPTDFKNELISRGIPAEKIYLDYAGFRTLDSVLRAKAIFGQESITFISQKFHNQRAIFLAEHHGMKAVGFNAKDIQGKYGFKTKLREYFARTKAVLDVIFDVEPKFYGEPINIS